MEKIGVVVLNFKLKQDTLKCIASVKKSTYKNIQIIVVDNNSGDNLHEEIAKDLTLSFIQTGDNLGYTGGNNVGIRYALKENCDFVFVLNPDTTINKDTIKNLFDAAKKQSASIIGPKILFDDKKTIWYAGAIIDKANVLGVHIGLDEKDNGQYDKGSETGFVTGAAILISKDVFEKIGLFEERYFLYMEDVDFCLKAKMSGFKIIYEPKALVFHKNAQATGLGTPRQDYYITRNRLLFAFKFLPLRTRLALLKHIFATINIESRRKALIDFLFARYGKGPY